MSEPKCTLAPHTCKHGEHCHGWELNEYAGEVVFERPHECTCFDNEAQIVMHIRYCVHCKHTFGQKAIEYMDEAFATGLSLLAPLIHNFKSRTLYLNWWRMEQEKPGKERPGWEDEPLSGDMTERIDKTLHRVRKQFKQTD